MEITIAVDRLVSAVRHVSDGWLPVQEGLFDHLEQRFSTGAYAASRSKLSRDLRLDPSLYLYCVRELGMNQSGTHSSPGELFQNSQLEDIHDVVRRARAHTSRHSFQDMTPFQANRLQETLISAITCERLASAVTLDPELGYTCGLLRQLGMTLTAWNFPREYEHAVSTATSDTPLNERLNTLLGFSPVALCSTMVQQWNLSPDIVDTVSNKALGPDPFKSASLLREESAAAKLTKICKIGEALARASQPHCSGGSLEDLESAEKVISEHLGAEGIQQIYRETKNRLTNCNPYEVRLPDLPDPNAIKEKIIRSVHKSRLVENNRHMKHLPERVRDHVEYLYQQLHPEKILKSALRFLVQEIIPKAGFERGCIYLYQPEKRTLNPSLSVGDTSQLNLRSIPIDSSFAQYDLIVSAYSVKAPLRSERAGADGLPTTAIAAAIGDTVPVGVLYLETKPELSAQIDPDPMLIFRAMQRVVADSLNAK